MEMLPDEKMIWEGHPTWRAMLAFHIKGFATTGAAVLLLWLLDWLGIEISAAFMVGVAIAGVAITILAGWIQRYFTEYAITTKRLHIRKGVLSKTESSTNVDRIQNITITQALIERMLQVGTLDFDTAGDANEGDDGFRFAGVNDPQDLRDEIVRARDADATAHRRDDQGGLA